VYDEGVQISRYEHIENPSKLMILESFDIHGCITYKSHERV
jgi:hypothetical protein